jgi:Ni,Fe-hydrogenase III large subunit
MNGSNGFTPLHNGEAIPRSQLAELAFTDFRHRVIAAVAGGWSVASLFADAPSGPGPLRLYAVLADADQSLLHATSTTLEGDRFPSLTPLCPQVHLFEREIAEQYCVVPEGHPWLKPVRFQPPLRPGQSIWGRGGDPPTIGVTDYYRVEGEERHEVAVGPVHAGVIEPGHFRFQCHGETVYHLEISLGYQHRGVERALIGGPNPRTIHLMETLSGDTSIGHATAYCQAVEGLARSPAPLRAEWMRGVALELERLANHTGDLGALAGDVGFLPTMSFCGRLRGDFLNLSALLCGSRFGRGMVRPGGVGFDIEPSRRTQLVERIQKALRDVSEAVNLLWDTPSVMARFENTGEVSLENCKALGMVGPSARACGLARDVRFEFPTGIFRFALIPVSTVTSGDVFARSYVRWVEIQRSVEFVRAEMAILPGGPHRVPCGPLAPDHFVASLVEGWRGEICHVALTDSQGKFSRYKIVDPSFHNWMGLALALRNQQISDFPLCNKSFNLSYCGYDL